MGIKPLLPSLREKKRYVAFEIISSKSVSSFTEVLKSFWQGFCSLLGELELARAGIILIKNTYNSQTQRGLVRVNNKYVDHVKAAFTMINNIEQQPVIVRSLGVSGVLNKAQKKYVGGY